jgi:hypothetical protein
MIDVIKFIYIFANINTKIIPIAWYIKNLIKNTIYH